VTNVLMAFFSTQRGDPKRFEMLQLLASVLSWTDEERERVGLQRSLGNSSSAGTRPRAASRAKGKEDAASEDGLENEVKADDLRTHCVPKTDWWTVPLGQKFSDLWIEFLLRESAQGTATAGDRGSQPGSPTTLRPRELGATSPPQQAKRSFSNSKPPSMGRP
jgi:hypothetical protein